MSDYEKVEGVDSSDIDANDEQEEEYLEWMAFARTDYESAKYLNGALFHPRPLNVICYHCQQAAEKAVKALIVYFGSQGGMPKVHDISFLLNQIKNIIYEKKGIIVTDELLIAADSLSKYGIAPRYPNEIEVDEQMTGKALSDSEAILQWAEDVIALKPVYDRPGE